MMSADHTHTPSAAPDAEHERTCVICKAVRPAAELVRLGREGNLVVARTKGSGRSAYVCAATACLTALDASPLPPAGEADGREAAAGEGGGQARASKRKDPQATAALSRAFAAPTTVPPGFIANLHALAAQRIYECVGLARRQGMLTLGSDEVERLPEGGVTLVAGDVAERTRRSHATAPVFGTMETLAHACGAAKVGVLRIDGRLAEQAGYWLRVWYESSPRENSGQ